MKKLFLLTMFTLTVILFVNAQEVGIRFGGTNGHGGAAVDGVFGAGPGRIHADLGIYQDGVGIDALWDFIDKPLSTEEFSWYLGAGPSTYIGSAFWLGISGEIGLEYCFNSVPISVGADWRPTFWLVETTQFGANSAGLNVRYRFGK